MSQTLQIWGHFWPLRSFSDQIILKKFNVWCRNWTVDLTHSRCFGSEAQIGPQIPALRDSRVICACTRLMFCVQLDPLCSSLLPASQSCRTLAIYWYCWYCWLSKCGATYVWPTHEHYSLFWLKMDLNGSKILLYLFVIVTSSLFDEVKIKQVFERCGSVHLRGFH